MLPIALAGTVLTACAADPSAGTGPRENTGTLVGAVAGATVGSQFGGGPGERIAAGLAGAAIGGLIGNRIGAALDDKDRERAYAAQIDALERGPPGAPVGWRNQDSGRRGTEFRGLPTIRAACGAGPIRTPFTSTAARKLPAGPPAAVRMGPGIRSARRPQSPPELRGNGIRHSTSS